MVKNYSFVLLVFMAAIPMLSSSQEIKIFTTSDFDLKGPVRSCLVSTNYGKEEYDFNKEGLLTKSVTRYSDGDYAVTYYKYKGGELIEKRLENYRDKVFDKATSIANFYSIDTTGNRKVTEKIVSYEKNFLDQYEYEYDTDGKLIKITRANSDGNDETLVEYSTFKDEHTISYIMNGVLQKSVRTSNRKGKGQSVEKVVLTKKFLNGEPNTAEEEIFNASDQLVSRTEFFFDLKAKQFSSESVTTFTYNAQDMLARTETKSGKVEEAKEYLYQFDNGDSGNWVKEIITPDNAYKTRKIAYHELPEPAVEEE